MQKQKRIGRPPRRLAPSSARITLRLTEQELALARRAAKAERIAFADFVRDALELRAKPEWCRLQAPVLDDAEGLN